MSTIGGFAFAYLPVMFAMAIPLGLVRKEKGIAAFSGFRRLYGDEFSD